MAGYPVAGLLPRVPPPHLAHFLTEIFPHLLFKLQGLQQCLGHKQMFSKCLLNPYVLGK